MEGDRSFFYKVAKGFTHRVRPEDRQDFLHDFLLTMAKVKAKYDLIGKELTEAGLIRVACYEVAEYWRKKFRQMNGTHCGRCSQEQRRKCQDKDLYRECPRAIKRDNIWCYEYPDNGYSGRNHPRSYVNGRRIETAVEDTAKRLLANDAVLGSELDRIKGVVNERRENLKKELRSLE